MKKAETSVVTGVESIEGGYWLATRGARGFKGGDGESPGRFGIDS